MTQEVWRASTSLHAESADQESPAEALNSSPRGVFFREFEASAQTPAREEDRAGELIVQLKGALESFEPAALQIVVDFCEYLETGYDITSCVEVIPAQEGWFSLRLRCRSIFPDSSPLARKRTGRFARLLNRMLGRTLPEDVFCVDLELHVQAKEDPASGRGLRLECCLSGSEPVEVLDENGVYREVPVLRKLRHLMQGECRRHLDQTGIPGTHWVR